MINLYLFYNLKIFRYPTLWKTIVFCFNNCSVLLWGTSKKGKNYTALCTDGCGKKELRITVYTLTSLIRTTQNIKHFYYLTKKLKIKFIVKLLLVYICWCVYFFSYIHSIRGHPQRISDFLSYFLTYLPAHIRFSPFRMAIFSLVISDFPKPTYLPKNQISFVDAF